MRNVGNMDLVGLTKYLLLHQVGCTTAARRWARRRGARAPPCGAWSAPWRRSPSPGRAGTCSAGASPLRARCTMPSSHTEIQ